MTAEQRRLVREAVDKEARKKIKRDPAGRVVTARRNK